MTRRHIPNGVYCSLCGEDHSAEKPVHRRPIRRLLRKLEARAEVIRRLLNPPEQRMRCIIVAEGEYEEMVDCDSEADADTFASGVGRGASLYGAGSCGVYRRADLPWLNSESSEDAKIIALIEEHLPEGTDD